MSGPSGSATFPSFVAEIDRLSDELELFGMPRMMPPEFMPNVYPNGRMEMESVKVLDLLHTLMDSLWTMVQARHRDRELQGDESDAAVKLSCDLKALEADFQRLQVKIKKRNHDICVLDKECTALKACQRELSGRVSAQDETIRMLKSQVKHMTRSASSRLAAKDIEFSQLKDRIKQGYQYARATPQQRNQPGPTLAADADKTVPEKETFLKAAILHYQRTTETLIGENLSMQQQLGQRGTPSGDGGGCPTEELMNL